MHRVQRAFTASVLASCLLAGTAFADQRPNDLANDVALIHRPAGLAPEVQADVGLAIVGLAYEVPVAPHFAVQVGVQIFSTYFAPWFSAGDRVDGFGAQIRGSWIQRPDRFGLYASVYLRSDRVTVQDRDADGHKLGAAVGGVIGFRWLFGPHIDLRLGVGAQYMRYRVAGRGVDTPFAQLDAILGYRF